MEKNDPALVPEWYRTGGIDATKKTNHHRRTSSLLISDNIGFLGSPRARSLVSTSTHDAAQSYFSTDTHSNSSDSHSLVNGSSPYRSFNNKRYQDKRRDKKLVNPDKRSSTGLSNGFTDYSDTTYKDTSLRSHTKVYGGLSISESKGPNNGFQNGVIPGKWSNGIKKSSFENEFPSLQKEENFHPSEIRRKPLSLSLDTISIATGTNECTYASTDVPSVIGGDIQHMTSSAEQSTHGPTTSSGLSMAEALAKGPSLTQAIPQPSFEVQRLNELAIKQSRQLIPVTPTTPKSTVVSSLDRLKIKAVRTVPSKVIPQLSSQSVNNVKCGFPISDSPKQQGGNFHVLNRERNNLSPTINKITAPLINSDIVSPKVGLPPDNPMFKTDKIQNSIMEKRHLTQDRIRFFNKIRNGSSATNKSGGQAGQTAMANVSSVCPTKEPENCNGMDENCSALIKPKNIDEDEDEDEQRGFCLDSPTEEEREFLISLGWNEEDAEKEESLTAEEIDDFFKKYHLACLQRNINISAAVRKLEKPSS